MPGIPGIFEHWAIEFHGDGPIILHAIWTAQRRVLQPDHPQYELAKLECERRDLTHQLHVPTKWEDTEYMRVPAESETRIRDRVMAQYGESDHA